MPWTEWLEPEKCVVSVPEAGNLELRCQQGCALSERPREGSVPGPAPVFSSSLACGDIIAVFTWLLSVHLSPPV